MKNVCQFSKHTPPNTCRTVSYQTLQHESVPQFSPVLSW
jgi:hypothetical protein